MAGVLLGLVVRGVAGEVMRQRFFVWFFTQKLMTFFFTYKLIKNILRRTAP